MTSLTLFFPIFSRRIHPLLFSLQLPTPHPLTSSPLPVLSPPLALSTLPAHFFSFTATPSAHTQTTALFGHSLDLSAPPANQSFPFPPAYRTTCFCAPPNRPIPWKGSRPGAMVPPPYPTLPPSSFPSSLSLSPLSLRCSTKDVLCVLKPPHP